MKYILLMMSIMVATSCMKSKDEYQEAITDVHAERQEEIQREEAENLNEERYRGSNDREGMGMDE